MRALLILLLLTPTLAVPSGAYAAGSATAEVDPSAEVDASDSVDPSDEAPAVSEAEQNALRAFTTDALGRPYPDPVLLRRTQTWRVTGYSLTGVGAGLLVGGIVLGTELARGIDPDTAGERDFWKDGLRPREAVVVTMMGVGAGMLVGGVPLASAGEFSTKQLKRTIKGAEKVPRTVANESRYWKAYLDAQYGQGMAIGGGTGIAMGILSVVAVGALVGTDRYDPRFWALTAAPLGAGVGLLVGGLVMGKEARAQMEAVRDEVDPLRQQPTLGARWQLTPRVVVRDGVALVGVGLSGSF